MARPGNNPKRRLIAAGGATPEVRAEVERRVRYVGSGHHKRSPADYGFESTRPRPSKSLCDLERVITLSEATQLLLNGVRMGMFSALDDAGFPKYIWSVKDNVVYESKTDRNGTGEYHGYPITNERHISDWLLSEWKKRCLAGS